MCMSKLIAKLKSSVLRGRIKDIPRVDDTLTKVGWAADASATGRNLATIQAALNSLYDATGAQVEKLQALIDGYKIDPVTGVKEWLFPPMESGVEYRLAERYLGKPVYIKLIRQANCHPMDGFEIDLGITDTIDHVVSNGYSFICEDPEVTGDSPFFGIGPMYGWKVITTGYIVYMDDEVAKDDFMHPAPDSVEYWQKYTKTTD